MTIRWSDALKPDGCFSRSQFALFYFGPIIATWILFIIAGVLEIFLIIAVPLSLLQIYVAIIAGIRRLHDLNRSGWYLLLAFVPVANIVMILYLLLARGREEASLEIPKEVKPEVAKNLMSQEELSGMIRQINEEGTKSKNTTPTKKQPYRRAKQKAESSSMNYCPSCGTRISGKMKYCPQCGKETKS